MPVTDAYTDVATYRSRVGPSATTAYDTDILAQLLAVSRYLDRKLNRFFTSDAAPVSRIYYPAGYYAGNPEAENPWIGLRASRDLSTDDIASTTGLVIKIDTNRNGSFTEETALGATDYELHPLNADKGPEPKPWNIIHLPAWSTQLQGWPTGCPVQVTARFGWPAIPGAIVQATIDLTSIVRLESPIAVTRTSEDVAEVLSGNQKAADIVASLPLAYKRGWAFA